MKITTIILLAACLQVQATGYGQKITLALKDAPVEKLFSEIRQQSGYEFLYIDKVVQNAKSVTIEVKDAPIEEVLRLCFRNQPFDYQIKEKTIIITPKNKSHPFANSNEIQNRIVDIKGKIVDAKGQPVPGATIAVRGTSKSTITDGDGLFSLNGIDDDAVIVITHVQYETEAISLNGHSIVNATLQIKISSLDEMQIIAYGTTTRRFNTGNVSTVKSLDIEKQPVNNPLLALQGRVPGLFIVQSTGLPGSGITVRIQGQNSLLNGSDPLYVIDGVPYSSQMLPTTNNILGSSEGRFSRNGGGNPLSFLNPSDIESIDVLKDADATSIYGSRAASGAILITTKKGVAGQTKIDLNVQNGWGKVTRKLDLMNSQQYLEMRKEAFQNDGRPIPNSSTTPAPNNYDLTIWDQSKTTDWQKVLIGGTAHYTDAQATVSGGTSNTQFLIGTGFHRETLVFPGDLSDQNGSVHFNINNTSANQKFRMQLSGNYMTDNNRLQSQDLTNRAISLPPNAPNLYNSDGSLNWAQLPNGRSTWINPLSYMNQKYQVKTDNLISNAVINYTIIRGLIIKSNFGYTKLQSNEIGIFPLSAERPERRPTGTRGSTFGYGTIRSWIIEPQVNYTTTLANSNFEFLVGTTFQQNKSYNQQLSAIGFNSDLVMEDIRSASDVQVSSTLSSTYNYNALFGRLNYRWRDKYLINLTARRDGSSRFGSKNLFQNFWSIGGGWIFSEERYVKQIFKPISFGKIRASYGTSGNDQIGDYAFMSLFYPIGVSNPYQGATGLTIYNLPNPHVQWEETRKLQFGLDLGLFKDRFLLGVNYYRNRSSNQLLPESLPQTTGFQSIGAINLPATVQNKGWELSLQTRNIQLGDFLWTTNINLTIPQNKLLDFPDLKNSSFAGSLIIGKPFTLSKVYHFLGIDPSTGLAQVANVHGNSTSKPEFSTDATVLINTSPKYYGGFYNNFSYKGLEISVLFQFVKQMGSNYFFGNVPGGFQNQPLSVFDRWKKVGDMASVPKYTTSSGAQPDWSDAYDAAQTSDKALSDASYIRLKNVSLSWQIPTTWRKAIHLQNLRLYIQGQNLLTITNYLGLDPENGSISSLPPLRILTTGIQVTF